MKKHQHDRNLLGYTLFLLGLIFLIEAIVFIFVTAQIPSTMIGPTISIVWIYAAIKFLAGLIAIYTGLHHSKKE